MIAYLVSEVLVLSFACELPATYDYLDGKCIDLVRLSFDSSLEHATLLTTTDTAGLLVL